MRASRHLSAVDGPQSQTRLNVRAILGSAYGSLLNGAPGSLSSGAHPSGDPMSVLAFRCLFGRLVCFETDVRLRQSISDLLNCLSDGILYPVGKALVFFRSRSGPGALARCPIPQSFCLAMGSSSSGSSGGGGDTVGG